MNKFNNKQKLTKREVKKTEPSAMLRSSKSKRQKGVEM
jgi:hypothetical protein